MEDAGGTASRGEHQWYGSTDCDGTVLQHLIFKKKRNGAPAPDQTARNAAAFYLANLHTAGLWVYMYHVCRLLLAKKKRYAGFYLY
uniref:Uncharacterized protein n=1 Tax=Setaria italica TaxID=4555 RepID=K3XU07_SETIT